MCHDAMTGCRCDEMQVLECASLRGIRYQIAGDPSQVRHVREQVGNVLPTWGLDHGGLVELVLSELMTNAIRHGEGVIDIHLSCAGGDLWIEVHDYGAGRYAGTPAPSAPVAGASPWSKA